MSPATRRGEETRDRILAVATELIHARGFKNTGLQDILAATGVPKGSFYFYFRSKEELGKELLVRYRRSARDGAEAAGAFTADQPAIPQILAFFRSSARRQMEGGCSKGCLLGNLAAEITDMHEDMRREVAAAFIDMRQLLAGVLSHGQRTGELDPGFPPETVAEFLVATMEGTILLAKARRDPATFEAVDAMLVRFLDALRPAPGMCHGTQVRMGGGAS